MYRPCQGLPLLRKTTLYVLGTTSPQTTTTTNNNNNNKSFLKINNN